MQIAADHGYGASQEGATKAKPGSKPHERFKLSNLSWDGDTKEDAAFLAVLSRQERSKKRASQGGANRTVPSYILDDPDFQQ